MRSLQCARAFAALLVVYFHAALQVGRLAAPAPASPFVFGRCGVDVFFVLSGFIIWTSVRQKPTTPGAFLARRFLRIAPLYWLLTLLAVGGALTVPSLLASTKFGAGHVLASLVFVPWANPAFSESPSDLMTPVLVPGWTLNFEMMFYALFAVALFTGERFRLAAVALLLLAAMLAVALFGARSATLGFYDPLLMAEFMAGVGLGALAARGAHLPAATAIAVLALGACALVALDALNLPAHRLVTAGLPAILVVAAVVAIERHGRWPRTSWAVRLGDASFSLYLTHVFVLTAMRVAYGRLFGGISDPVAEWAYVGVAVALSCLVGLATYRLVERPLGRWATGQLPWRCAPETARVSESRSG